MISDLSIRAGRREAGIEVHPKDPAPASVLVETDLTPTARQAATAVEMSLVEMPEHRASAVFLGRSDYEKVEHIVDELLGCLLMECLPAFVREHGGQIAFATRFERHGQAANPVQRCVTVGNRVRRFLVDGQIFIHFPDSRVCVSSDPVPVEFRNKLNLCVRSDRDTAGFWERWQAYARAHGYLRGQAFFADGELIQRKRAYSWEDILLPEGARRTIRTQVEAFLRNGARLKELGVKARRGVILAGPPGTGKTLLGKVLADTLEASFLWVLPRHVRCAESFQEIMAVARFVAPTVVFLEDLDLFGEQRDHGNWFGLGELMNQLDGALDNDGLVAVATTNRLEVIEKALRNRPGRFDRVVQLDAMDEPCRRRLLERLLAKAEVRPEDLAFLVQATNSYTGAQIEELANTLYILALEQGNHPAGNGDAADGNGDGERPPLRLGRHIIDMALEEVRVERKARLGFHST